MRMQILSSQNLSRLKSAPVDTGLQKDSVSSDYSGGDEPGFLFILLLLFSPKQQENIDYLVTTLCQASC